MNEVEDRVLDVQKRKELAEVKRVAQVARQTALFASVTAAVCADVGIDPFEEGVWLVDAPNAVPKQDLILRIDAQGFLVVIAPFTRQELYTNVKEEGLKAVFAVDFSFRWDEASSVTLRFPEEPVANRDLKAFAKAYDALYRVADVMQKATEQFYVSNPA